MQKKTILTIHEKNKIIQKVIDALLTRKNFLILGHMIPDEDCIGSMVSIALIISKFSKDVQIYLDVNLHEHFQYLLSICEYNSIKILYQKDEIDSGIDTIIICDTPKPSMVSASGPIQDLMKKPEVIKIEIDHHLGADSEYIGDDGYCLVAEASSASELVGLVAMKLRNRKDVLEEYNISDFITRNLVLSILTGIIGDSKMGQYLKSKREKKYYHIFSNLYNNLLVTETVKESNFMNMDQVYREIQRLSNHEDRCNSFMLDKKVIVHPIGLVVLNQDDMKLLNSMFEKEIIVNSMRVVADSLAEESGKLSLVVSDDAESDLIQFRIRRSHGYKTFDVREVLTLFSIENGGGHEGAIGFRLKRDSVSDLNGYISSLVEGIRRVIP